MITTNVLLRVFRIRGEEKARGTAFTLDVGEKQYLVTAKHLVGNLKGSAQIDLFSNGTWKPFRVKVVGHAEGAIDISVLAPGKRLTPEGFPLEATAGGLIYAQDAYFLGYPYDLLTEWNMRPGGHPMPLVKKAIVSAVDAHQILLDGHNNPGFSGGPVVFSTPGNRDWKVAAVISNFRFVDQPILRFGKKTDYFYEYNTGIIMAYQISYAKEIIESNPIGLRI